jgi:hypothetical protein
MTETDFSWHASFKPHFTQTNQLIYKSAGRDQSAAGWKTETLLESENDNVKTTFLQGSAEKASRCSRKVVFNV